MTIFIAAVFTIISFVIFCFLLIQPKWANYGLILFILMNSVLFIPFGYLSNNEMRVGGIPLAYIPLFFLFINIALVYRGKINSELKRIFVIVIILLFLLLIQSIVLVSNYSSFFIYYLMWIVNLLGLFFFAYFTSKQTNEATTAFIKAYVFTIVLVCSIGCAKYIIGITEDANFFSMINRNGTIIPVVFAIPLCLALYDGKRLSWITAGLCLISICMMILFTQSRMGFITAVFSIIAYYQFTGISNFRQKKYSLISVNLRLFFLICFFLVLGIFVLHFFDKEGKFVERLLRTQISIASFFSPDAVEDTGNDYARKQLLLSGIEVVKTNWLFGTGVGLENYRVELTKVTMYERESKPHNFFISYLGEFGILAFSLLILVFLLIIIHFEKNRKADFKYQSDEERYYLIAFETTFLTFLLTLTMNEYVTFPFVWYFIGIGLGVTLKSQHGSFNHSQ